MADKDFEKNYKKMAKDVEETRKRLVNMEAELARRTAMLDERLEEQEANEELADVTAPNGSSYQYRKERISGGDQAEIKEFTRFGWQYDNNRVFHYKNGDIRIKFWRDMSDDRYAAWRQNEKTIKYLFWLYIGLGNLLDAVRKLPDKDYFFESKNELQDCQRAFRAYEAEVLLDKNRVESIKKEFEKRLDSDGTAPFKEKSNVEGIASKYLFVYDWELEKPDFAFNVIKYEKSDHHIEALCASNKELALSNAETEMERAKFNAKKRIKNTAALVGAIAAGITGWAILKALAGLGGGIDAKLWLNPLLIALGIDAGLGLLLLVPTILLSKAKRKQADEKYADEKMRIERTITD